MSVRKIHVHSYIFPLVSKRGHEDVGKFYKTLLWFVSELPDKCISYRSPAEPEDRFQAAYCRILPTLDHYVWESFRQLMVEHYLHWTTTFGISFSGSSHTNHGSSLYNTTYTGPLPLRYLFRVVQIQTTTAHCRTLYLHWTTTFEIFFR